MDDRLYNSRRWRLLRERFLKVNPLCIFCKQQGRIVAATVVDHIKPHGGDLNLFWDEQNWQPLCVQCHNKHKQQQEKSGYHAGCGVDGLPIDGEHPWNKM